MPSTAEELAIADIFADDSENERTFYGFSDSETGDPWVSYFSLKGHKIMFFNGSMVIVIKITLLNVRI